MSRNLNIFSYRVCNILFFLNFITLRKQITIELGNTALKGRYERETHARNQPEGKKMQKYKIQDKIEKRKWICTTELRINVKLVRVYYGRWHTF